MNDEHIARRAVIAGLSGLVLAPAEVGGQDAARIQPDSFKVVLENDYLRVLEYNSRPGMAVCGSGMHSHPAHLTIVLSAGRVRIRNADGTTIETDDTPPGLVFWSEAETHETENISGRDMRSLVVELKPQHQ